MLLLYQVSAVDISMAKDVIVGMCACLYMYVCMYVLTCDSAFYSAAI